MKKVKRLIALSPRLIDRIIGNSGYCNRTRSGKKNISVVEGRGKYLQLTEYAKVDRC